MDHALKAVASPVRRRILQLAWAEDVPASRIAADFAMSRPGVSQHLRVLEAAGLVNVRRDGTRRLYRTNQAELGRLREFMNSFWDGGLPRLKAAAEAAAGRGAEA